MTGPQSEKSTITSQMWDVYGSILLLDQHKTGGIIVAFTEIPLG